MIDLGAGDAAAYFGVVEDQVVEVEVFFPGTHGVGLNQAVGIFAGDAAFDQVEEKLSAED